MRRPPPSLVVFAALCLLGPAPRAAAQDAPPAAPLTLAQAEVSRDTVTLAVAAEKVMLPAGADPPPPGSPAALVADAYGQLSQSWETAAAAAPPTMTQLNTDPGTPNPYDGTPPSDALKLLLGGLDDGQWQALTGSPGLGYGDLTGDGQRNLFLALFPGDRLDVRPQNDYDPQHAIKLTADDLRQARLRLCQQVSLMLPSATQARSFYGMGTPPADDGKAHYEASQDYSSPPGDTLYGVQVRATVPNALKPSDLDAEALTAPVAWAGVKTVGDLVTRLGLAAHRELYADPRYAARSVTLTGPPTARAGDLLRALALCVCGAYRRVGPAYVLTDDLMGLGTRQMILSRFAQAAEVARSGAEADAGDKLVAHGGVLGLPSAEPGLGITDAQRQAQEKDNPFFSWFSNGASLELPFDQLTPQQQALARREQKLFQVPGSFGPQGVAVTLNSPIMVHPQPSLQLLSPAVPAPVTLGMTLNTGQLFQPSAKLQAQLSQQQQASWQAQQKQRQADAAKDPKAAAPPPSAPAPPPPLASLLARTPRRAVLAAPRTAEDVDALIASMRGVGLNQLWLDVFSGGKPHLDDGVPGILTEALRRTKGTGIAVIPTLDLLDWTADATEDVADRTMLGETSAQAADYQQQYQSALSGGTPAPKPLQTLTACPAAPEVLDTLTALVQRLAATPGVAALALRGTTADGYDRDPGNSYGGSGSDLGYTVPLRLACLRRTGLDPLDLSVPLAEPMGQRASVPGFDENDWQATQDAGKQWNALRAAADLALMRRLLAAAQEAAGRRLPLLVKQRGQSWTGDWWGLWDDPRTPLPALTQAGIQASFQPGATLAPFAHGQCRTDIYALSDYAVSSPQALAGTLQQLKPGWDGVVIDATASQEADPLAALAKSLTPSPPRSPSGAGTGPNSRQ